MDARERRCDAERAVPGGRRQSGRREWSVRSPRASHSGEGHATPARPRGRPMTVTMRVQMRDVAILARLRAQRRCLHPGNARPRGLTCHRQLPGRGDRGDHGPDLATQRPARGGVRPRRSAARRSRTAPAFRLRSPSTTCSPKSVRASDASSPTLNRSTRTTWTAGGSRSPNTSGRPRLGRSRTTSRSSCWPSARPVRRCTCGRRVAR